LKWRAGEEGIAEVCFAFIVLMPEVHVGSLSSRREFNLSLQSI
jgi:hypothetical protein